MSGIPTKRLLVYIVAGAVVVGVGTTAVFSMRGEAEPEDVVTIATGAAGGVEGGTLSRADADWRGLGAVSSTIVSTEPPPIYVQVAGAVARPGVYEVSPEARAFQVIQKAGGFTADADQQSVALAATLSDGCRIYVPRTGESPPGGVAVPQEQSIPVPSGTGGSSGAAQPVSINSAGLEQFDSLPGVGPATAQNIITYREANGPFTSIEELTDVPGIGPAKLEQIRPLVVL